MTNAVDDLLPNEYIHRELISDEDHPSIDAVLGLESIDRHDDVAIISAMRVMEEESPPLDCFDAAISAVSMNTVALNGMNKEYVYDSMPNQQDQVIYPTMLSNRLDRIIGTRVEQSESVQSGVSVATHPKFGVSIWIRPMNKRIKEDRKIDNKNRRRSKGTINKKRTKE